MRWVVVAVALVGGFLAGCLGAGTETQDPVLDRPASCGDDLRNLTSEACSVAGDLKVDVPLAEERTLDEPPQWRLGEWWRYRITDRFEGEVVEATRVVAGVEGDNYLVGMPAEEFSNDFMVLHVPGFGQVDRADLSFETHDCDLQLLQFPLTDGLEWDGEFECAPFDAVVTVDSPTKATILTEADNGRHIIATYDAVVGEIVSYDIAGYALIEIIDHGYDYAGLVTVPHMHDVIFIHARYGPAFNDLGNPSLEDFDAPTAKEPWDVIPVDTTYDRVSFILAAGDLATFVVPQAPHPTNEGYYDIKGAAPDGETYRLTVQPPANTGLVIDAYMHMFPGGDWRFDHTVAGPGITLAEGIAYHVYDVDLPSGRILPSMGEHAHGDAPASRLGPGHLALALGPAAFGDLAARAA